MKRIDFFFILMLLCGCDGYSFGLIGAPGYPTKTTTDPQYIPGKGYQCTTDEQCGEGITCYKKDDSYVGVCSKVNY